MSHCLQPISQFRCLAASKGAGIRCTDCDQTVYVSHRVSSGIARGLWALWFPPLVLLLFGASPFWWDVYLFAFAVSAGFHFL